MEPVNEPSRVEGKNRGTLLGRVAAAVAAATLEVKAVTGAALEVKAGAVVVAGAALEVKTGVVVAALVE